jgi:hypothetical protein
LYRNSFHRGLKELEGLSEKNYRGLLWLIWVDFREVTPQLGQGKVEGMCSYSTNFEILICVDYEYGLYFFCIYLFLMYLAIERAEIRLDNYKGKVERKCNRSILYMIVDKVKYSRREDEQD